MVNAGVSKRNQVFGVATILITVLLVVAGVEWGLRLMNNSITNSESMDEGFILYDDQLGWKLSPGWQGRHRHHDFEVIYRTNEIGLRGNSEDLFAAQKVFYLGDSFTFGLGVGEGETFTDWMNQQAAESGAVYSNLGIPGYAPDQQLIFLESLLKYEPDEVVWVIYLGNDLLDIRYPFPLQAAYGKPYFIEEDKKLLLRNSPVPLKSKFGKYQNLSVSSAILGDYDLYPKWRDYLNRFQLGVRLNGILGVDEDALKERLADAQKNDVDLFMAMVERAKTVLQRHGGKLSFVLMPGSGYFRDGTVPGIYQSTLSHSLSDTLANRGYKVLELGPLLEAYKESGSLLYHPNEGHLTPTGHKIVGEILFDSGLW
ncbi:SGNH/GDSL hydrolase family protein [Marinobacter nauticus]|uniref:SGNH/GDSL hydrolase family protein n=1 Tax=Marinobacter nauticus TaxID=2743 RepID=UPI001CD5573B|nr:SGNH/GDSL hydrolase family protein [Marinobacter nauticus]MCA0911859.1 SGNH/GDSL hydrolase family protein [Marinobacter nauticus]